MFYQQDCIASILERLRRIEILLNPGRSGSLEMFATINGKKIKVVRMFQKVTEKIRFSIEVKDVFGNQAQVDGLPQWESTDADAATLEVSEDGLSCLVIPKGKLGVFSLQVKVDADLGEGVKEILGSAEIDMVAGEAATINIVAGTPELV
jgi:hypothetical protein